MNSNKIHDTVFRGKKFTLKCDVNEWKGLRENKDGHVIKECNVSGRT